MQETEIPPPFVFVGQSPVQLGEKKWREGHCVRYHTSVSPENYDLPDAITFTNRGRVHSLGADALSVRKVDYSGEADVHVTGLESESSKGSNEKMLKLLHSTLKTTSSPEEE